jgi:DNA-directed RNA polymerase subunit K/omega
MIIPLDKLMSDMNNNYVLTSAIIKRATQIHLAGDDELEQNKGKVVSTAMRQVLDQEVTFNPSV